MIKNISLITEQIKDFTLKNIEFIDCFYLNFQNGTFDGTCFLEIEFIIQDQGKQYHACFRFSNPNHINFESLGTIHQLSIEIYDIRDRGWENKIYEVIDCEDHSLHFYCTEIEIISLRETRYHIKSYL